MLWHRLHRLLWQAGRVQSRPSNHFFGPQCYRRLWKYNLGRFKPTLAQCTYRPHSLHEFATSRSFVGSTYFDKRSGHKWLPHIKLTSWITNFYIYREVDWIFRKSHWKFSCQWIAWLIVTLLTNAEWQNMEILVIQMKRDYSQEYGKQALGRQSFRDCWNIFKNQVVSCISRAQADLQ
jgi:hypothetical protein